MRRIEIGMNDDDEIAEVFNTEGNAEVLTHEELVKEVISALGLGGNDMFRVHGEVQFMHEGLIIKQTIQQALDSVNDNITGTEMEVIDIINQYDYSDGDGYIQYIYSLLGNNGEFGAYSGVQYTDGRFAVVGVNRDHWEKSYDSMVSTLISGL